MTDDELIERMVQEAAELGPMGPAEFERETEALRAYARKAWQADLELEHGVDLGPQVGQAEGHPQK